jgi:2-polyprenyl-3-methyl-5-hydroxy-6-metoxy-1,4-benzoquinol methylase
MSNYFDSKQEEIFLNSLVTDYKDISPYSQIKKEIILQLVDNFLIDAQNKQALQLGCANGYETKILAERFQSLLVVDGSTAFIQLTQAAKEYKNVKFKHSLFENLNSKTHSEKYDYIFCHYVLEHVFDPATILQNVRSLLKSDGILFVVVPNSQAFSRQLALQMGYINKLEDLTENDHKHGHRRVYNMASILSDVTSNGFKVHSIQGIVFKVLADFQLNKLLNDGFFNRDHIFAMQKLAQGENMHFSDSFFLAIKQ